MMICQVKLAKIVLLPKELHKSIIICNFALDF